MAQRFDKYRMKDGKTPLGEGYFNPIWQDIDVRLAAVEEKKASFDAAVQALTDVGLTRINEVLAPSVNGLADALAEVAAARVELAQALADAEAVFGEIVSKSYLVDELTTLQMTVDGQLTTLQSTVDGQLTTLQSTVDGQLEAVYALAVAAL